MDITRARRCAAFGASRSRGTALRTALAGGLTIGLIALVTPPGGADPRGESEEQITSTRSLQQDVRITDEGQVQGSVLMVVSASPTSNPSLEADLAAAREEETAAFVTLAGLTVELDLAKGVQSAALEKASTAQDALMQARVRLGELIQAEDSAATDLNGAVSRVEREHPGSKARRSAFTQWQMAAVAERAAHARRAIATDVGTHLFDRLRAAESALADAELALGEARSAHLRAERASTEASGRVVELESSATPVGDTQSTSTTTPPGTTQRGQP